MLILTRRVGEAFLIGGDITITIVGVKGNQVRIGIEAPEDLPVYREEIAKRIRRDAASPDNLGNMAPKTD